MSWEYMDDSRVSNAREQAAFDKGCDVVRMTYTFSREDEQGEEVFYTLPVKWKVCPTCQGRGSHVNPSIDAGGISSEDPFWSEDCDEYTGESRYFRGDYDVTCYTCHGRTTVLSVNWDEADKSVLAIYEDCQDEELEYEALCRAERRMGA